MVYWCRMSAGLVARVKSLAHRDAPDISDAALQAQPGASGPGCFLMEQVSGPSRPDGRDNLSALNLKQYQIPIESPR